ncbi:MAG: TetR/AcrR family transcriptional regulator [Acidimicrobiales bacterium]
MTTTDTSTHRGPTLTAVVREVKGPRPILSRVGEANLTRRQREVLDQLLAVFADGFAHLTMADIAAEVRCSLRTLYELAPSRDDLVLLVVDRHMWKVGRTAVEGVSANSSALDGIRAYLRGANEAVAHTSESFAEDTFADPRTRELMQSHSQYLIDVTRALLDDAVAREEIMPVNTAAAARVLAGLGADLSQPGVIGSLNASPKDASNELVDIIIAGLEYPHRPND